LYLAGLLICGSCGAPSDKDLLFMACADGDFVKVQQLLNTGIDPNIRMPTLRKKSPLLYAIEHGQDEIVVLLLKRGANPNQQDGEGISPIVYALRVKDDTSGIVSNLVIYGAFLNEEGTSNVLNSISEDDPKKIALQRAVKIRDRVK
jgi:hypothetical protein